MNKINLSIIVLLILFQTNLFAQNPLNEKWKFKIGDDPEWASLSFNDTLWTNLLTNESWENQGFPNYDGYAFYRTTVIIPSIYKADAEKYGGLWLHLGKIKDVDSTFFNGKFLIKTGSFPPNFISKYITPRNYTLPVNEIKWDKPNVIAVKVYNYTGSGGLYLDPVSLVVKEKSDLFTIQAAFKESDQIIRDGSDVVIPIRIKSADRYAYSGKLSLSVVSDFKMDISNQSQDIKIDKKSVKDFTFIIKDPAPGFYNVVVKMEGKQVSKTQCFSFGVKPEKIQSLVDHPADFESYWNRARKELAAVDPQFKVIKMDSLCTSSKNVFLVEMRSLGNVLIRGWYTVPKKEGKHPAILQLQGYSSNAKPAINYGDDFIRFCLNIRGHGNSRDNVNPGFPGYLQYFINDKEQYIYRGAYMDCIRAMDFLFSRPEVDTTRVVVEGVSQGGALTIATAALDNKRVRLCVPQIPFLSDFPHYFQIADWPGNEFVSYVKNHPKTSWETVYNTLSYIDIKNLAGWVKCPVLMGFGLLDKTCPPHINFAAYNQLTCHKEYIAFPTTGHDIPDEFRTYEMEWIRKTLGVN